MKQVGWCLAVIVALMSGCGPAGDATPTAGPIRPSATAAPSATPVPSARPRPSATITVPAPVEHASGSPQVSAGGGVVVYQSSDPAVLGPDAPRCPTGRLCWQVLRYSLSEGTTAPVSVSESGAWAEGDVWLNAGAVSATGQRVVFTADLTSPPGGNPDGTTRPALYWRDFGTGQLRTFHAPTGGPTGWMGWAGLSANGDWIVFERSGVLQTGDVDGDNIYAYRIWTEDLLTATRPQGTALETVGWSFSSSLSANGRWLAFWSFANLTPEDANLCDYSQEGGNLCGDVYVYDTQFNRLQWVAMGESDGIGNSFSRPAVSDSGFFLWLDPWVINLRDGTRYNFYQRVPQACAVTLSAAGESLLYLDPRDGFAHWYELTSEVDQAVVMVTGHEGQADLDLSGCDALGSASDYQLSEDLSTIAFVSTRAWDADDQAVCPSVSAEPGSCPDVYVWRVGQPDLIWVSRPGALLASPFPTAMPPPTQDVYQAMTEVAGERLPTPEPIRPADAAQARQTLRRFLTLLAEGDFVEAAPFYGGSAVSLWEWSGQQIALDDRASLLALGCERRLLQCLPVRAITDQAPTATTFEFTVEFSNPDGTLFVRGPCCGASEAEMPSASSFAFSVIWAEGQFRVLDLPPYVP